MSIRHFTSGLFEERVVFSAVEGLEKKPLPLVQSIVAQIPELAALLGDDENETLLPQSFRDQLFESEIFSLLIPRSLGGVGASIQDFCRVVTPLARLNSSAAVTVVPHSGMGVKSLLLFGSPQQQEAVLTHFSAKKRLVAFALTEAGAGSDVASHRSTLASGGHGQLQLDGNKIWITNAAWAGAMVVCARCPQLTPIPDGSAFVLVKPEDPGVFISQPYAKMGLLGSATCQVDFDRVILPADRLMGKPGRGVQQFNQLVDTGRLGVAAGALGLVQRLAQLAPASHLERELFVLQSAVNLAALAQDLGLSDASLYTALAKSYATERCLTLADQAMQQHPLDFFQSGPLSRLFRDVPILRITEGPNEVLRFRTGLDLAMSRFRKPQGLNQITPLMHQSLRPAAQIWDEMLGSFEAFCAGLEVKYDRFVDRQYVLERLVQAVEPLWLIWSCLLATAAMIRQQNPQAEEAIAHTNGFSKIAIQQMESRIRMEHENRDLLKDELMSSSAPK